MYKTRKEIQSEVKDFQEKLELDNETWLLEHLGAKEYIAQKKQERKDKLDSVIRMLNSIPRVSCSI